MTTCGLGLLDQAARLNAATETTTAADLLTRDVGGTAFTSAATKANDALTT